MGILVDNNLLRSNRIDFHMGYNRHMELYSLNFLNGKKYIGISYNSHKRFYRHLRDSKRGSKILVHLAIRKSQPELQVLCIGSKEYISSLEIRAISSYRTQDRRFGYNITAGGEGLLNPSLDFRKRLSEKNTGEKNPNFGKVHTEEAKRIIGEHSRKRNSGVNHPMYGKVGGMKNKTHTEEAKLKCSLRKMGSSNPNWSDDPTPKALKQRIRRQRIRDEKNN